MAFLSPVVVQQGQALPALSVRACVALGLAFRADDDGPGVLHALRAALGARRRDACVVPRDWRHAGRDSAAALACRAAGRLLDHAPAPDRARISALIYCHDACDESITDSTVGRLQHELGLGHALAFAVSQCHHASVFNALDLALGLLDEAGADAQVLIAASDKLLFEAQQDNLGRLRLGDTAAAVLVGGRGDGAWRLRDVQVSQAAGAMSPAAAWTAAEVDAMAQHGAEALHRMLAGAGLRLSDLGCILACGANATLTARLDAALGGGPGSRPVRGAGGWGASADALLAIAAAQHEGAAPALVWAAGNNGEFACCTLTH